MFSFQDPNGNEMCLRPDLTIVSCLRYLKNKSKTKEKIFYSGQAFRKIEDRGGKIIRNQIGYEIIGSKNVKQDIKVDLENLPKKLLRSSKYLTSTSKTLCFVKVFLIILIAYNQPRIIPAIYAIEYHLIWTKPKSISTGSKLWIIIYKKKDLFNN